MNISLIMFIIGIIFIIIGYVNQVNENINNKEEKSYIELDLYKRFINDSIITQ